MDEDEFPLDDDPAPSGDDVGEEAIEYSFDGRQAFEVTVHVTQRDIDRGGAQFALAFAIARAVGVDSVIVHKGPAYAEQPMIKIMPSSMDTSTAYNLAWGGKTIRLPGRCQVFQRALVYGPGCREFAVRKKVGEEIVVTLYPWEEIVAPFTFRLQLPSISLK